MEPTSGIIDVDASFIRNSENNLANGQVEEVLFCFYSLILCISLNDQYQENSITAKKLMALIQEKSTSFFILDTRFIESKFSILWLRYPIQNLHSSFADQARTTTTRGWTYLTLWTSLRKSSHLASLLLLWVGNFLFMWVSSKFLTFLLLQIFFFSCSLANEIILRSDHNGTAGLGWISWSSVTGQARLGLVLLRLWRFKEYEGCF